MPLLPGESFLQASARAKREKAGAKAIRSFLPDFVQPPPKRKVPPVPKAVKDWEKKSPAQKLQTAGFLGAQAVDKEVTRYRFEREAARMADVRAREPTVTEREPPSSGHSPSIWDYFQAGLHGRAASREPVKAGEYVRRAAHGPIGQTAAGLYAGSSELRRYLATPGTYAPQRGGVQYAGVPTPKILNDALEIAGKVVLGGAAGAAGILRHPERTPEQLHAIASDMVQPIGLGYAAATGDNQAWRRLSEMFVQESIRSLDQQYGPGTSWRKSLETSYNQGPIAVLQALAVAAPAAKLGSITAALRGGASLGEAWKLAGVPPDARVLRLAGGSEATGRPVQIPFSRSALIRGTVQRPYDVISRHVRQETPVIGHISEPARAARVTARQLKRSQRRLHAEAVNLREDALDANEAEQLRTIFTRDMPENFPGGEEAWLDALHADVNRMLTTGEFTRAARADPKARARLERRVEVFQRKFDREKARAAERDTTRKIEPLLAEEKSLKAKIRSAQTRKRPTEELGTRLAQVQDQLAVARGEPVRAVANSPARAQMQAVFTEALGPERGPVALQVADQLARGAEPDNPTAWYERILTQYAEDPEASGVDLANAMLQEAGPRRSLAGSPYSLTHDDFERALNNGQRLTTTEGESGFVSMIDGDRQVAAIETDEGHRIVATYDQFRWPGDLEVRGEAPVFYSAAQKYVAEKLPPKVSPDQLGALLAKNLKPVELEWSGMGDWIEALKDSGIKSVTKEEVIHFLADPLNAFDLSETLWEHGAHPHGTRWDPDRYAGVTLTDIPGDYKELMVQLPGTQVYSSSGHMPGISNPIVQLRFHEVNRDGFNEILIDEMQSDWGAAIRDNDYRTKSATTDAEIAQLTDARTRRIAPLVDVLEKQLGISYYDIQGGTNAIDNIPRHLQDLIRKLDSDWLRQHGLGSIHPRPDHPSYAAWEEWMATPERKTLERVYKHAEAVTRRDHALLNRIFKLQQAPADMPYKKSWELLGLKRMVAYAVQHGYDAISWPQGIVPAIRYQKVIPEHEGVYAEDARPEDHPQYPSEDDYTRSYTYHEHEFDQPDLSADPIQDVLFGPGTPEYGIQPWHMQPQGVPMSATQPLRMTSEELGFDVPQEPWSPKGPYFVTPKVDDLIYMDEGPFANQFIRVSRANEDGTFDVVPSRIEQIEVQGNGSDSGGGWSEYQVTVTENGRNSYGSGTTAGDALRGAGFDDVADSEWFDDVETKLDQGWESELDDYEYREAVNEFMERWHNGEVEGMEEYGGSYTTEELAQLDVGDYKGNAYRYDTIFPSVARKEWKRYGVEVEKSTVDGSFTVEGRGRISEPGPVPTWKMRIPEELANDVRQGQSFFQAVYPISGTTPIVKGAVELLGNRQFRMTLFNQADITTAVHELGHIALYDMDADSIETLSNELAGGRAFPDWTQQDHERFARAWERYFLEGYASTTSLRNAFNKIKQWMREVYNGLASAGEPISPDVRRVFDRRLGKVDRVEGEPTATSPAVTRYGVLLSKAKDDLARFEQSQLIQEEVGTTEALQANLARLEGERDKALGAYETEKVESLTEQIRDVQRELEQRDVENAVRYERRQKLLASRAGELRKALEKPDSRRYDGAVKAADFFQDEREAILREVFGDRYDDIFAGRRAQMSRWLAEHGAIEPEDVGEGRGFMPYRRRGGASNRIRGDMAAPTGRRIRGKGRTSELNINTRNQMVLFQQGDYRADIDVLFEQYVRALSYNFQLNLRQMLHEIGEPVDPRTGPKEGWYLIDPDATVLPRHWDSQQIEEIDADLDRILDGLAADDEQHVQSLKSFAESWLVQDPAKARKPDGSYGNVRQVHPRIVNRLMIPYTGNSMWNPLYKAGALANTLARTSLIYASPGYIPSNILANATMLFAERGVLGLFDFFDAARLTQKDSKLYRRINAEMGETITTSKLRGDTGRELAGARVAEGWLARKFSAVADDPFRVAAWSGVAKRHGYKGREAQLRLLNADTPKARHDREVIAQEATKAMIDFDRLTPWEQRWLRPMVFVWPFIRGATAWPIDYAMAHPFRAGAAVALTHGYGEEAREELGPTPDYYPALVPIEVGGRSRVANLASVSPLGPFTDVTTIPLGYASSAVTGEDIPTFRNLASFLAPQTDLMLQLIRGQGEFGQATSVRELLIGTKEKPGGAATEFVPLLGLTLSMLQLAPPPASQLDNDALSVAYKRTMRFSPQDMNLSIVNQQAKDRGARISPTQQMTNEKVSARAAWNQLMPGDHMPRSIEDSINAYYVVSAMRAQLKEDIKTKYRESYQPTKREPTLTQLQEAAIVYDVLAARMPDVAAEAPDPSAIFEQYGEEGVKRYRANIERVLFAGKRKADEARRRAKQLKKAA